MNNRDVTIYDIAEVLNVSPATVSRGLKDHPVIHKNTRKKIQQTALKMGYQHNKFASNLRRKNTNTIGVVIPRLNSYFMSTVIAGMEKVANVHGYNLLISQSQESAEKEIDSVVTMFNSRVDGLMVSLGFDTTKFSHFENLIQKKIPLIFFDRVIDYPDCTCIVIDNKRAGYEATMHLIQQDRKRIAHICGNVSRNVYADRLEGYKLALLESGIDFQEDLVISSNLSDQAGAEAAQQLLSMKTRPDGIFASNDTSAVSCIREIKKAGLKVPQDIAIVGFNNDPISTVIEPNLTTVNYPGLEMGEIAATTLISHLKKEADHHLNTIVLKHNLIVRQSSLKS